MDATKRDQRFSWLLKLPVYLWTLAFVFVALLYVLGLSFLSRGEVIGVGGEWTLDNYARLGDPSYLRVLMQSLRLAVVTTLICAAVGVVMVATLLVVRLRPRLREEVRKRFHI